MDIGTILLTSIKSLLNLENTTAKDMVLQEIITNVYSRVLTHTGYTEVPEGLLWVVKEATCSRYNQLGSEGIHSELNEGIQFIYDKDILSEYYSALDKFVQDNPPINKKRFRMM